jgi:hypothetical protein
MGCPIDETWAGHVEFSGFLEYARAEAERILAAAGKGGDDGAGRTRDARVVLEKGLEYPHQRVT